MNLKSLFNLDSGKYSLSNSAGAFRRVKENTKPLSLADLIGDLIAPKIPTAEELPKVNPIDTESVNSFMQVFGPASSARTSAINAAVSQYGSYYSGWYDIVNGQKVYKTPQEVAGSRVDSGYRGNKNYTYYPYGSAVYNEGVFWNALQDAYNPYRSNYNSNINQYNTSIKPSIDTYNSEITAYNAAISEVKQDISEYQAEVTKRANEANTGLVNPNRVDKETSQKTGDILSDTELYSEGLHSMMIDRISAQPVIDEMSALFSKGSK